MSLSSNKILYKLCYLLGYNSTKCEEKEREKYIEWSENSKKDIELLERTDSSDMISDKETLANEDEDNTHDEEYVMNTSKSSFKESFFD